MLSGAFGTRDLGYGTSSAISFLVKTKKSHDFEYFPCLPLDLSRERAGLSRAAMEGDIFGFPANNPTETSIIISF